MERDRAIGILERLQSAGNAFYAGGSGAMLKQLLTADISSMVAGNNASPGPTAASRKSSGISDDEETSPTRPSRPGHDGVHRRHLRGIPNAEFAIRPRHLALPRAGEADAVQPGHNRLPDPGAGGDGGADPNARRRPRGEDARLGSGPNRLGVRHLGVRSAV